MGQFHTPQFYIPQLGAYLLVAHLCSVEKKTYPQKDNFLFLGVNKGNNGNMFYWFSIYFLNAHYSKFVVRSVAVEIDCSCIREILTGFLSWIKGFVQSLFVQYIKISQNLRSGEGERHHQYSRLKHFVKVQELFVKGQAAYRVATTVILQLKFKIMGCFQYMIQYHEATQFYAFEDNLISLIIAMIHLTFNISISATTVLPNT